MNKRIKFIISSIVIASMSLAMGCSSNQIDIDNSINEAEVVSSIKKVTGESLASKDLSIDESDSLYDSNSENINLNDISKITNTKGISVTNNIITISESGTYALSGSIDNGQIVVDAEDSDKVKIILDGASIKCTDGPAIYVKNADKTILELKDDKESFVQDGREYVEKNNEADAAIFSSDDLIITGNGLLNITSNYKDGIHSKDDLVINSGSIAIDSLDDGIVGKDSVDIKSGSIDIKSKGDGIQATNSEEDEKGYVYIEGGTINISSDMDGIQAENSAIIVDGNININTGGGNGNAAKKSDQEMFGGNDTDETSTESKKGIKSAMNVEINGGIVKIDSCDDSIHSDDSVTINAGTISILSGDDGIHGDYSVNINGGKINIDKSYEGLEAESITINDGEIYVKSSDDGVNASEKSSSSGTSDQPAQERKENGNGMMQNGQKPEGNGMMQGGQKQFGKEGMSSGNATLNIDGGYLYVDADGDGLDANGSISMTGGTVIVNGPTNGGNGSLDYDSACSVTGGLLIACGSAGMLQAPDSSSTQNIISAVFSKSLEAGTSINIKSDSEEDILTFTPSKEYESIVLCSPKISKGVTYTINAGGTALGQGKDGLYENATIEGSTESLNCTVTDIITSVGNQNSGMQKGQGGFGQRGNKGMRDETNTQKQ